jgi:hypothetical protein
VAPQRVATREPARAHPNAPDRSVHLDGLAHVVGARWIEAAGPGKKGRQKNFIQSKQPEDGRGGGRGG